MNHLFSRLLLVGVLGAGAMGCRHSLHYSSHGIHRHHDGAETIAVVAGVIAGAALVEAAREPEPERVYYSTVYYYGPPPPPTPRSPRDLVEDDVELPPFDPHAARSALNGIEVSTCREAGAPTGFGHAKVTFNPDGRISKVVVDEPPGMSEAAAKCIGDRIGTATVPPFKGSLVTMGTTYHVR